MAYDNQQTYAKFQSKKCHEEGHKEGCGCKEKTDDCSCCPPGLIGVYDENGKHQGCLSPNDAEAFSKNCSQGMIGLYDNAHASKFLGCVPSSDFPDLNSAVNGSSSPIAPTNMNLVVGGSATLDHSTGGIVRVYPIFVPVNTTTQDVTWSSSDAAKASVSVTGLVTAIAAGTTTVKATSVADPTIHASTLITVI